MSAQGSKVVIPGSGYTHAVVVTGPNGKDLALSKHRSFEAAAERAHLVRGRGHKTARVAAADPSSKGRWGSTSREDRVRKPLTITIGDDARRTVEHEANVRGQSISVVIEGLIQRLLVPSQMLTGDTGVAGRPAEGCTYAALANTDGANLSGCLGLPKRAGGYDNEGGTGQVARNGADEGEQAPCADTEGD